MTEDSPGPPDSMVHAMEKLFFFGILSLALILISRRSLVHVRSHGFYRFLCWECILWLFISNVTFWFKDPFTYTQIISWLFLFCSGYLVLAGAITLKKKGKAVKERSDESLYPFERTTVLVDQGIYKYIRHPLYASLLFLTWGIYLKHATPWLTLVACISTVCLYLTATLDEKECIEFFGEAYGDYMKRSKRFIPFIL